MSGQPRASAVVVVAATVGWVAAVVAGLSGIVIRRADPAPVLPNVFGMGDLGIGAYALQGVVWATVGAVLMVKRPGNIIGLLCLVTGLASAISALGPAIVFGAAVRGGLDDPLTQWSSWATGVASILSTLGFLIAMVFPTGRGHTQAWDLTLRVLVVLFAVWAVALLTQPGAVHLIDDVQNPLGFGIDLHPLLGDHSGMVLVGIATVVFVPVIAWSVLSRYRAGGTVERLQLRWFGWSVAASLSALALAVVSGVAARDPGDAPLVVFGLASALVPVAIGIAILRYHLYDIDRIVSSTIAYSIVSLVLVAVFAAVIVGLQAALATLTNGETIAVAASTLLAASLFQPVRGRVQTAVDRRFHRARYDADRTVATFAARLRGRVDLASVRHELELAAVEAVEPAASGTWLRTGDIQ